MSHHYGMAGQPNEPLPSLTLGAPVVWRMRTITTLCSIGGREVAGDDPSVNRVRCRMPAHAHIALCSSNFFLFEEWQIAFGLSVSVCVVILPLGSLPFEHSLLYTFTQAADVAHFHARTHTTPAGDDTMSVSHTHTHTLPLHSDPRAIWAGLGTSGQCDRPPGCDRLETKVLPPINAGRLVVRIRVVAVLPNGATYSPI